MKYNIKGYLPCFDGFYHTVLEFDFDSLIDSVNYDRSEKDLKEFTHWTKTNEFAIDYKKYHKTICLYSVEIIENELKDLNLIEAMKFEELISPKFYNYSNDEINVEFIITEDNKNNLLVYIKENKNEFETYIKNRFTDYSGFISFYSNDSNHWIDNLKNWKFEKVETEYSVLLEFVLLNENEQSNYSNMIKDKFNSNDCESEYLINYDVMMK